MGSISNIRFTPSHDPDTLRKPGDVLRMSPGDHKAIHRILSYRRYIVSVVQ